MGKMIDNSIVDFTAELASSAAVPGGGGASALAGALGIALGSMAGSISASAKKPALYELNKESEALRAELLSLIDEDAKNFAPLSKAYAKPKTDPDYAETMRSATIQACSSPIAIMRCCCKAIELLENTRALCSKLLLSDIACGASICRAALESASFNVFVNTKSLSDADASPLNAEADAMLSEYLPRAQKISDDIKNTLRGCDNNG